MRTKKECKELIDIIAKIKEVLMMTKFDFLISRNMNKYLPRFKLMNRKHKNSIELIIYINNSIEKIFFSFYNELYKYLKEELISMHAIILSAQIKEQQEQYGKNKKD